MQRRKISFFFIGILLISGLPACSTAPIETPLVDVTIIENVQDTFPQLADERFAPAMVFETEQEIYTLTQEQFDDFSEYFNKPELKNIQGHIKISDYLVGIGERFKYKNKTNNATETLATASGNCMSLAMLTTALARAVDVEIKYQMINRIPIYQEFGSVIFNSQHIRSVLYGKENLADHNVLFRREKSIIDYYPSLYNYYDSTANSDEVLSMYYRNLAAEALGDNNNNRAFWLLKASLEVEPENAEAINTLAVLHRRIGEIDIAEALYKYGIKHASNKIVLLKNYKVLLESQGREEDVGRITKELEGLDDYNPFRWLMSANESFDNADYRTALKFYQKAIDIAPYLHQAYLGIAKTQLKLGNNRAASKALIKAQEEAFDEKAKTLYTAKLEALKRVQYH